MSILKFKKPDGTWESIAAIKGEPGKDGAIQYQAGEGIKIEDNVISADVTKEYIVDKIEELADMGFTPMIVESLPIDDIQTNTIYMIPSEDSDGENIYEEWMYINGAWEKVGSTGVKPSPIPVIVTSENIANNSLTLLDAPEQINTILPTDYNSISNAPMVLELITTSFANGMKHVLFEFDYTSSHTSKLVYVGYHYDTTNSGSLPTIYRCLLTINLSQSNGVYTCNRVSYSRAKTHQYLSTTNTTEFTPTSNYHPATKKYVDDSIANIDVSGDSMKGVYVLDIPDFSAESSTTYYSKEQYPDMITTFESAINKAASDGCKTPILIVHGSIKTYIFECKDYDITKQTYNIHFTTVLNTNNENEIGTTTYVANSKLYLVGTWVDGVYTQEGLGAARGKMQMFKNTDVLLRNNTSSFTPTSDYHPATKKYVDDGLANAGGGPSDIIYIELNKTIGSGATFNRNDSATIDLETKFNEFTLKYKKIPMIYVKDYTYSTQHLYTLYSASSSTLTFLQMGETSVGGNNSIYHNGSTLTISGTYDTQTKQISITSFNVTPTYIFQYLSRQNTDIYTPTSNYHPATKKYVDDQIKASITTALESDY